MLGIGKPNVNLENSTYGVPFPSGTDLAVVMSWSGDGDVCYCGLLWGKKPINCAQEGNVVVGTQFVGNCGLG